MRRLGWSDLGWFVLISAAYWSAGATIVMAMAIHVCGMTPDSADLCDPTPIGWTAVGVLLAYLVLAAALVRATLFGKR